MPPCSASLSIFKCVELARHRWLKPVIIATQEAEIRITVQSQPRQIVHKTLSQKNHSKKKKKGLVEWLKV
jgi:hypothetical protein